MDQKTPTDTRKPSLKRIIQSDYASLVGVVSPIIVWGMYLAILCVGYIPGCKGHTPLTRADAPLFFFMGIAAALLGIPLFVWRVRRLRFFFARGMEVTGRVVDTWFFRGRGRVEYTYTYQGHPYRSSSAVNKTGQTGALEPGDEMVLIVDPQDPKRALIRDLYV